jgi:hypothetical protein
MQSPSGPGSASFAGGQPDLKGARDLLQRTRLGNDPNMQSLLEMRRPGPNPIRTRQLLIDVSSESRSNLKALGRVRLPTYLKVKLGGEYERVVRTQLECRLKIDVSF